jgi:Ca2+-transporting ATPase
LVLKDIVTSLILAIIIIVVAVPEGLPMMIAIVLSLNMRKLLKVYKMCIVVVCTFVVTPL